MTKGMLEHQEFTHNFSTF